MQEPTSAISGREALPPEAVASPDDELLRVETLLAVRSREASALHGELSRQRALLREALERVTVTTSGELSVLRRARDAAVQRAIEAELGRAALAFELDETRACLQTMPGADAVRELRSVYSRVAQLEETEAAAQSRVVLVEQDLVSARERIQQLERQRVEESEAFELNLLRARASVGPARTEQTTQSDAPAQDISALYGELNGLRARLFEAERALVSAREHGSESSRKLAICTRELEELRARSAEMAVLSQARAGQISELGLELSRQQQDARAREGQLAAALAAQQAERQARDADVQAFLQRIAVLENTASQSTSTNASAGGESRHKWARELREFLASLRAPLAELEAALVDPDQRVAPMQVQASETSGDATHPGTEFDAGAYIALEDRLRTADARIAELEATLAARQLQLRDAGLVTLKGELIDTRADAARLSDDLTKERVRRRKLVFTVRALQAATESGEAPGPWIEELITLLNEGASVPPFGSQPPRS